MDCLEFRRLLGSEPRVTDPAARAHLESCARCQDAYARAQALEARIASALAVAVPEGLADRILLAELTEERQRRRANGFRYGWVALAAAAALVVAIGLVVVRRESIGPALPDLVVAHVDGKERDALNLRAPVPAADVDRAFADRGVTLKSVPDGISYVHKCPVGGYATVHMVMPVDDRPVGVVYVTRYRAPGVSNFERSGWEGREVPIADGTLVMIGPSANGFDRIEHAWRDAIEGPAETAAGSR
jgi:anti-sigma factor RsiW